MSQLSSPTPPRKSRYRGYDIKMERRDLCWMVTMKPSRPGLPKFPQPSFQTATQSTREALSQAERRVDHAQRVACYLPLREVAGKSTLR